VDEDIQGGRSCLGQMAAEAKTMITNFPYPVVALEQSAWKPMNHGPGHG